MVHKAFALRVNHICLLLRKQCLNNLYHCKHRGGGPRGWGREATKERGRAGAMRQRAGLFQDVIEQRCERDEDAGGGEPEGGGLTYR